MAEWWPFDRSRTEEWKRNLTELLAMSSAAAASLGLPQPGTLTADPFALVVDAARARLVGKKQTFRFAGRDMTMTLSDISVDGADLAKVVGQYGTVRIYALDVHWGPYHLERLEIRAQNMHLRPGTRPTLVAAPVFSEAFISASFASRWLAGVSPWLELVLQAGVPQVGAAGMPWLRLEMETGAEGRSIRLRPAPCTCSNGACRCRPRRSTCPCRICPTASCSPRSSRPREASWSGACSATGSDRCRGIPSSGC